MTFMQMDHDRARSILTRRMRGISNAEVEEWLALEPRAWVLQHGPSLHEVGLSAQDAADLYRRIGNLQAFSLPRLISQGRMADIDVRYVHLWAASGLLKVEVVTSGSRKGTRAPNYTRWVSEARRYITGCGGDQHLAALAAAAGLSVEETIAMRERGDLEAEALGMLAAFREATHDENQP